MGRTWCKKGGARGYVTTRSIEWRPGGKFAPSVVTIPEGFEFESSVPKAATIVISPDDPRFLLSACVHDYFLEVGRYEVLSAAAEWHSAAKKSQAPKAKRFLMFVAVCWHTLRAKHYTQA